MSLAAISAKLHAFREKAQADQIEINKISQESPMDRMRREIQLELEQAQQYRTSILQNVTTFGNSRHCFVSTLSYNYSSWS